MSQRTYRVISIVLRLSLAVIFIYSSFYKIQSPGAFAQQIYNYKVLPSWAINPLAIVLPWIQLLCGILLLTKVWVKASTWWIIGMLVVFQAALASALFRDLNVSCGCFKSGGKPATWLTFGRDFIFLVMAVVFQWMATTRRFCSSKDKEN